MQRLLRWLLAATFLVAGLSGGGLSGEARAETYVVLVNAENNTPSGPEAKAEVARLFMKRQSEWSNGLRAEPFDRTGDSAEHSAFVQEVLESSQSVLDEYWLRLRQTRGETPPREVGSARLLLRAIGRRPGAFGFAAKSEVQPLPDNTRILFEFGG